MDDDEDFGDFVDSSFTAESATPIVDDVPVQSSSADPSFADPFDSLDFGSATAVSLTTPQIEKVMGKVQEEENSPLKPVEVEEVVTEEKSDGITLTTQQETSVKADSPTVQESSDPFDFLAVETVTQPISEIKPDLTVEKEGEEESDAWDTFESAVPVTSAVDAEIPTTATTEVPQHEAVEEVVEAVEVDASLASVEKSEESQNSDNVEAKQEPLDPFDSLNIEEPFQAPESLTLNELETVVASLPEEVKIVEEEVQVPSSDVNDAFESTPNSVIMKSVESIPVPAAEEMVIARISESTEVSENDNRTALVSSEVHDPFESIISEDSQSPADPADDLSMQLTTSIDAQMEESTPDVDPFEHLSAEPTEGAPIVVAEPTDVEEAIFQSSVSVEVTPTENTEYLNNEGDVVVNEATQETEVNDQMANLSIGDITEVQSSVVTESEPLDPFDFLVDESVNSTIVEQKSETVDAEVEEEEESGQFDTFESAVPAATAVDEETLITTPATVPKHEVIEEAIEKILEEAVEEVVEEGKVAEAETVEVDAPLTLVERTEENKNFGEVEAKQEPVEPLDPFDSLTNEETTTTEPAPAEEEVMEEAEVVEFESAEMVVNLQVETEPLSILKGSASNEFADVGEVNANSLPENDDDEWDNFAAASITPAVVKDEIVSHFQDESATNQLIEPEHSPQMDSAELDNDEDDWDNFEAAPISDPVTSEEISNETEDIHFAENLSSDATPNVIESSKNEINEEKTDNVENAFGDDDDEWDAFEAAPTVTVDISIPEKSTNEASLEVQVNEKVEADDDNNDWDAFESAPVQSTVVSSELVEKVDTATFGNDDDEWDAFEGAAPTAPAETVVDKNSGNWDAFHGTSEASTVPQPTATASVAPDLQSISTTATVIPSINRVTTGNPSVDQEIDALQTLLGANVNQDFMNRLATLKNLTNQLYQIEKESTVAAEQEVVKDVDAHILWLDNEITPAEATPTLTRWKATRSDNHHLVVRQILIENIPPNACSLEQLQNELDCESKKYVVKTAEMKHRRVSSSESMLQDALSSFKTSSSMNNISEASDNASSDWNVGTTSSPPSPVPFQSTRQEDRNNNNNNNNNNQDLSKAAADFLRSLPNLGYILQ